MKRKLNTSRYLQFYHYVYDEIEDILYSYVIFKHP